MLAKVFEYRDGRCVIPVLAIDMNVYTTDVTKHLEQRYLLKRTGFPCDGKPNILLTRLPCNGVANNNPRYWGDLRFGIAHEYIVKHWHNLKDGDVIDVEHILGETPQPKISTRLEGDHGTGYPHAT